MSIVDTTINKFIESELIRLNDERESRHEPSGRLSASMLYQPVRFQLLKTLGAPRKPFDAYTLAKFKRGIDVEEWYVTQLRGSGVLVEDHETIKKLNLTPSKRQAMALYRDVIGFVDSLIDTGKMQAKRGIIPNEIKSITNMKWKQVQRGGIDWHYKIQACLYALAMQSRHFAVTVVSAEDLRTETHIFNTSSMSADVDRAIDAYNQALQNWEAHHKLPAFEANPEVAWTGNLKYAMFEERWATDDIWAISQLEQLQTSKE